MAPSKIILASLLATAVLTLSLAGCITSAKAAKNVPPAPKPAAPTPAAAPTALSIPQTQVELPRPQPIDPAALPVESPPAPPPPAQAEAPQPVHPPAPPPRRPQGRPEATAPTAVTPPETERPQMQEIVSAGEVKQLQDSAQTRKREVARILTQLKTRRLNRAQNNVLASINSFVTLSDEAEKHNDMRQADALAERAQILARDLLNGK
jgi:hypothetical protein